MISEKMLLAHTWRIPIFSRRLRRVAHGSFGPAAYPRRISQPEFARTESGQSPFESKCNGIIAQYLDITRSLIARSWKLEAKNCSDNQREMLLVHTWRIPIYSRRLRQVAHGSFGPSAYPRRISQPEFVRIQTESGQNPFESNWNPIITT